MSSRPAQNNQRLGLAVKFAAGPAAFLLVWWGGVEGLSTAGHIALGTLAWQVMWWILQPIPWAITSLLIVAIFPLTRIMSIQETAGLFGQRLFFWIMGLTLMGYAIQKHGLAKRFALFFLTLPGVASKTSRLLFFYMLATACVSTVISSASTIAMMLPLGLAIHAYVASFDKKGASASSQPIGPTALGGAFTLATLYGAISGAVTTIAGMPHSPVALAQLETLTSRSIGWFEWMMVGGPVGLTLLVGFYLLLRFWFGKEFRDIPGGREFLLKERSSLGKMGRGEKNALFVFVMAVTLFIAPAALPTVLGFENPLVMWLRSAVPIWVVPPIIMVTLFVLPVDLSRGEFTLTWEESVRRLPWHVLLLVTSATALIEALAQFGFVDIVSQSVAGLGTSRLAFPFLISLTTAFSTNFVPGVPAAAIYTGILIPIAQQIGFNPASIAILVPNSAVGILFPWAGATTATAFGFGQIHLKDLIRVGIVAELLIVLVASSYCLLFEPIL